MSFIRDTAGALAALQQQVEELNITRQEIDRVWGRASGYASKVLCVPPIKRLSLESFLELSSVLGLAWTPVQDPLAIRYTGRLEKRDRRWVRKHAVLASSRIPWLITKETARELGSTGGKTRAAYLSPSKRRKIARKGALIRWSKVKAVAKGEQ